MSPGVTPDIAAKNFEENYLAAFGATPRIRRLESGGFSVKFPDGAYQRYTKRGLLLMAGFYKDMLLEAN